MDHPSYLHDFAIVLGVAALTSVLFRRMRQSSILGYLVAGFIVGPYIPVPLFAETERVTALSEFGVVLVMFVIGLEFQLTKLLRVLPTSGFAALIQMGSLLYAGNWVGHLLGWTDLESLFLGASIAISSTMIVSKLFEEKPVAADVRSFVMGVLVVQDVAAIVLITAMAAITESGQVSTWSIIVTLGRLGFTLVCFIAGGLLIVPRVVRFVNAMKNKETLVVTSIGICFCFSLLAEYLDYSVALGAFVAGLLVAESGKGHEIEVLITPIKDMFVAIFFVSIGMSVDPALVITYLGPGFVVFFVVLLTQLLSVSVGGILFGNGFRQSITAGLALGQIGEFAFIISGIGVAGNVLGPGVQPVVVTVAILSAFSTPIALTHAAAVVQYFDRHIPDRIKNTLVFYESWFEKSRKLGAKQATNTLTPSRRAVRALALDTLLWVGILFVGSTWRDALAAHLVHFLNLPEHYGRHALITALVLVSLPPLWGIVRNTNAFVHHYSERFVAGSARRGVIMTDTSQEFLRVVLRMSVIIGVGIPLAAVLKPLIGAGAIIFPIIMGLLIMLAVLWKSAGQLDHEITSEAQRLVAFLDGQRAGVADHTDQPIQLPDISSLVGIEIPSDSPWVGQDLRRLDLRAKTGALILAIHRDGKDVAMPTGSQKMLAGDLLMITGTSESMSQARARLKGPVPTEE